MRLHLLLLAVSSPLLWACHFSHEAGDPPLPTRFVGLVMVADIPSGGSAAAMFVSATGGSEIFGAVPDGRCTEGRYTFSIQASSGSGAAFTSVGPTVDLVSSDGIGFKLAKKVSTEPDVPTVFYELASGLSVGTSPLRASWSGDSSSSSTFAQPFDAELVQMPPAPLIDGSVQAFVGQPLTIHWQGPSADLVVLTFYSSTNPELPTYSCAFPDTGSAKVPADATNRLTTGHDRVQISRVAVRRVPYLEPHTDRGVMGIGLKGTELPLEVVPKRVFVTSATFTGDLVGFSGIPTGLDAADNLCTRAAEAASLGGVWRAWLSDESTRAVGRMKDVGPWYLLNGVKVADTLAKLDDGPLSPIAVTELGQPVSSAGTTTAVWTGALAITGGSNMNCQSWTRGAGPGSGYVGLATRTDYAWDASHSTSCGSAARLYCLEQ